MSVMRYRVKDKVLAIGDDSWIEDDAGDHAFRLDGKAFRLRQTYELQDAHGTELLTVKKKAVALRDTMIIERDGDTIARVHKKIVHLIKDRFSIDLGDAGEWSAKGDFIDKDYEIEGDDGKVAEISRKWLRLRDTYTVDIVEGHDVPLVLAAAVAIDTLAELGRDH